MPAAIIMSAISAFSASRSRARRLYQITLGGSADEQRLDRRDHRAAALPSEEVADAIETIVDTYLGLRPTRQETFLDAYRRVGPAPFKEALYAAPQR